MDEGSYLLDLLGLEARLEADGPAVGTVSDLLSGGNDLLEITTSENRKLLIPFVEAIVPEVQLEEAGCCSPHRRPAGALTDLSQGDRTPGAAILGHHSQDVMASAPLIPVILCGGTGTRLWPLRGQLPQAVLAVGQGRRGHVAAADPTAASGPGRPCGSPADLQ